MAGGFLALVAAAEFQHWRASRALLRREAAPPGGEAVLVLGYAARDTGRPHPLQRWRTEIAARSMDADRESRLIFTGSARSVGRSEAEIMAAYARDALGVAEDRIVLESKAESTWQNVEYSLPDLESAATIKIASDPMHAARAREYLGRLRPDLLSRVVAADDYRLGEKWWLKLPTAAFETQLRVRRQVREALRR